MPKLNAYIEVGFCAGYGDGDYRVSMNVQRLNRAQWNELQLAVLSALSCAREHWMSAQHGQEIAFTQSTEETGNG